MNKENSSGMSKKEWMRNLRAQGLKYHEIADLVGVSRQYVAAVCGKGEPAYFRQIGEECIWPSIRNWMNQNKVTRRELLRRMGFTVCKSNYERLNSCLNGSQYPNKPYIDKLLKVTGMTYEKLWEESDGEAKQI